MIIVKNRYAWFLSGLFFGIALCLVFFGARLKYFQTIYFERPNPYTRVVGSKWAEADYYRGTNTVFDGWISKVNNELQREEKQMIVEAYEQTMRRLKEGAISGTWEFNQHNKFRASPHE